MKIEEEMIEAIKYGNVDELSLLIKRGGDVNKAATLNYLDGSILAYALEQVASTPPEVVKLLIDAGADVNHFYFHYELRSVLMQALRHYQKPEIIKLLIDAGADVNFQQIHLNNYGVGKKHHSVLTFALETNLTKPEVIKLLIDAGADVNYTDSEGYFPSYYTSSDNIEFLVNAGVDVNREVPHHGSLLSYKISHNDRKLIKIIIDAGANVDYINSKGESLLLRAIDARKVEVVCMLIDAGAAVDYMDPEGNTALTLAEKFKGTDEGDEIVEILKPSETGRVDTAITNSFLDDKILLIIFLIMAAVTGIIGLVSDMPIYILLPIVIANLIGSFLEGSFLEDKMMQGTP